MECQKKQLPADNTDWNWAFLELAALGLQNAAAGRIDDGESHRTSAPPCQPRKKKGEIWNYLNFNGVELESHTHAVDSHCRRASVAGQVVAEQTQLQKEKKLG